MCISQTPTPTNLYQLLLLPIIVVLYVMGISTPILYLVYSTVATRLKSAISARMVVFYKTRNQIISTVIIQINPFYGCLKASSNRHLLFTVHPLSSNSDIVKLRSYKRLWESACLALIQPALSTRRLVNVATDYSRMREFHQFQAAAWFVIT